MRHYLHDMRKYFHMKAGLEIMRLQISIERFDLKSLEADSNHVIFAVLHFGYCHKLTQGKGKTTSAIPRQPGANPNSYLQNYFVYINVSINTSIRKSLNMYNVLLARPSTVSTTKARLFLRHVFEHGNTKTQTNPLICQTSIVRAITWPDATIDIKDRFLHVYVDNKSCVLCTLPISLLQGERIPNTSYVRTSNAHKQTLACVHEIFSQKSKASGKFGS